MMPLSRASNTPGLAASASQMCRVAASIPCATIWSTFWVITAESDLPSNAYTSAPYFSMAYFLASANCAWWNTLDRSDTKNAIFIGLSAGFSAGASVAASVASVAGASVGAAGSDVAAPPQAANTRLASTSRGQ